MLALTTEGFLLLDHNGEIQESNSVFLKVTGFDHKSLLEKNIADLISDDLLEDFASMWSDLLNSGAATSGLKIQSASNKKISMEMDFFFHSSDEGGFVCVFAKEMDLDAEQKKLLKLKNHALAVTANAVVITDAEGLIVWVNRSFSKYTGYALDEAVGQEPGTLLKSGRHPESFYKEMWSTIQRGDIWKGEIFNRHKNGTLYPEEMTITPMFSENGEITHYIAVKQDISEKKNLQQMFMQAQRLESIGTLASGVAHDLNNVLAPIMMSTELLMFQTQDPETREMLEMILSSAKRGAGINRQLLNFARGDTDEMMEIQLRHLLKELVKVFRETFPKYIVIEDKIASNIDPIHGNAGELHQVFTNLMINARDAMPEGGDLLLEVDNVYLTEQQAEKLPDAYAGKFVCVRVRDSGIGIPLEIQEKVFEAFYTTKGKDKGTGLGLSTSLKIIKDHKGFIHLESEQGAGATFEVYIPRMAGAVGVDELEGAKKAAPGKGEHILVIDDEESIGFMLKGTLESLGYKVKYINNGREGVHWWLENQMNCDLILLDMMMPEMDGCKVVEELKKYHCQSEIILMSGMVSEEKLRDTEVDMEKSFIAKPFTILDVSKIIRCHLDK